MKNIDLIVAKTDRINSDLWLPLTWHLRDTEGVISYYVI